MACASGALPTLDANTCTEEHAGWPVSRLGQPVVRTCHTRMNCPEQRGTGLQDRTAIWKRSYCTSSSQKAESATLGAEVHRNQDGETKLQLFLPTWQVEKNLTAGLSWKKEIIKPEDIQRTSYSVPSSPPYLHPPPVADISWMTLSPEVTLNPRDSALHLKLKFVQTCTQITTRTNYRLFNSFGSSLSEEPQEDMLVLFRRHPQFLLLPACHRASLRPAHWPGCP